MKAFLFFLVFCSALCAEPLKVRVSAKAALVMNAETGAVLFEKNGYDKRFPGSITKIATALYALSQNEEHLDEEVVCPYHCLKRINPHVKVAREYKDPSHWLETDGTMMGIKQGEKLPFIDLLYGLMLVSGNDAANYIAHHVSGTIPKFMRELNAYVKKIGCQNTFFCNPHGLHHPKHVTTAYDMALMAKEAIKHPLLRVIASAREYTVSQTNLQSARMLVQNNQLLTPGKFFYSKAIGLKTGYHSDAGNTIVAVAEKEGRTLIVVLLGCENSQQRYRDTMRLFETAFAQQEENRLLFKKEENLFSREIKKANLPLKATLLDDVSIRYFPAEEPNICVELNWEELSLPIQKGSWVGEMHILDGNHQVLEKASLYATKEVKKSPFFAFVDGLKPGAISIAPVRHLFIVCLLTSVGLTLYGIFRFGNT